MIRDLLTGGNRRSLGRSRLAVEKVSRETDLFGELITCLLDDDRVVCMRAADAAEKISREKPFLLQTYKHALLGLLREARQKELRWHLALMIPRLNLTAAERDRAQEALVAYLEDRSSIVKTFAMQGLADLARQAPEIFEEVIDRLRILTRTGTPAMKARGRKLLNDLER
jgi:hypothetical protein